ncbi:MAG: shikimate dehydrogenase [Clostridia bacterium]|nr:shikimate dehydrogenase [Clostridia bacterium]
MNHITAKTKLLGVIGNPIEHSFSPKLHNYIIEQMNSDYVYTAFNVEASDLKYVTDAIRALGIKGINVTAPYKAQIMQYLDVISDDARLFNSVNTVVNRNGKLYGYTTDAEGCYASLVNEGIEICNKNVLVIGAGGVVTPTIIRLIRENPKSVTVVNRTQSKTNILMEDIFNKTGYKISTNMDISSYDVVINTTSAGMSPKEDILPTDSIECIKNLDFINEKTSVVDMIYNPEKTFFLRECEKRGAKIANGLGMLIYQGIFAYELFTDTTLPTNIADMIKKEVFNR